MIDLLGDLEFAAAAGDRSDDVMNSVASQSPGELGQDERVGAGEVDHHLTIPQLLDAHQISAGQRVVGANRDRAGTGGHDPAADPAVGVGQLNEAEFDAARDGSGGDFGSR